MFKLNKFFAFFALFLGFYISGIAINLNQIIHQPLKLNEHVVVKENKNQSATLPFQFFEPVDEREIDEDEQIRFHSSLFSENQILTITNLLLFAEEKLSIPSISKQHVEVKLPRFILFHSWKYYIS